MERENHLRAQLYWTLFVAAIVVMITWHQESKSHPNASLALSWTPYLHSITQIPEGQHP